jgi:hypothetical protein
VQKLSELNFKIVNKKGKEFVVHINRLKKSNNSAPWKFETVRHPRQRARKPDAEPLDETVQIQSRPIATEKEPEPCMAEEGQIQVGQKPKSPEMVETPAKEGNRSARLFRAGPRLCTPTFSTLQKRAGYYTHCTTHDQKSYQLADAR